MILSDSDIRKLLESGELVIKPLYEDTVRENGVDLRFSGYVGIVKKKDLFEPGYTDPEDVFEEVYTEEYILKPGEFIILSTEEYISLSDSLMGFINLRSSFARLGLILSPTIVDAGFEGNLTVGLYSSTMPVKISRGTRFLHLVIGRLSSKSSKPYRGRYRGIRGLAKPFTIK